ncbi:MAG TPA: YcaO-like family protein [Polyangiales bacterium]|nr:YcaO-like family protein [Polyangiales bacterium]
MTSNWADGPTRKIHPHSARVAPLEETERRLGQIQRLVPITRVSDLTPLDPLGVPVFIAVTPLARDLTTHAGKGACPRSARVSAMMEAVERVSAERPGEESTIVGSARELAEEGFDVVDPRRFQLPSDTTYDPTRQYRWVRSSELHAQRDVLMIEDLVCSPPSAGVLHDVDTNGLASGNTKLEAVVHGLCEVIERDLISQVEFATLFADPGELQLRVRGVVLETLPAPAQGWIERSASHGLAVCVQHLESDLGVPTFRVLLIDPSYPSPAGPSAATFVGFGAHPNAELAVVRALSEAFQSRVGFIHGGRDSFNTFGGSARRQSLRARCEAVALPATLGFQDILGASHADLRDDLAYLLAQLTAAGFTEVVATDLTRRELGIPVVRVRVPGFESFVVNRRRVGFRCLRHLV